MDHANRIDGTPVWLGDGRLKPVKPASCGIAFMAKASVPGRTKTRLVPPLSFDEAAALNTAFLKDVAANVLSAAERAGPNAGISGYAAYTPAGAADFFHGTLPTAIGLIEASLPNFGDCLLHTVCEILSRGHSSAVVLNSDSPTLPTALLVETAAVLALPGDRAVLGPSSDGGYYLLGLKTAHRRMFENIDWSTERVAGQTLERAREINLDVHQLPMWYDIDDIESLRRLYGELCDSEPQWPRDGTLALHHAVATAALIRRLWRDDFQPRVAEPRQFESVRV